MGQLRRKSAVLPEPVSIVRARTLLLAASALALACAPACFLFQGGGDANVLLIVVDSLRYDALSRSPGAPATPNLQALGSEGVSFQNCFSHSPITAPALASLLSSRLPHEHGMLGNGQPLGPDVALLPEWMQKRGYRTWGAAGLSTLRLEAPGAGLERGFGEFRVPQHETADSSEIVKSFGNFLAQPSQRPWFAMLHLAEPREPFEAHGKEHVEAELLRDGAPAETLSIADGCFYEAETELPPGRTRFTLHGQSEMHVRRFGASTAQGRVLPANFERGNPRDPGRDFVVSIENPGREPVSCTLSGWIHDAPSLEKSRKRYRLEVEEVDRAIGDLVSRLKSQGLYDRTLVIVTSDHGEALGEHGRLGVTANLYDELLHVPLLVKPVKDDERGPLLGRSRAWIVRQIDLAPTLLQLAGVRAMPGMQGTSLLEPAHVDLEAEVYPPEANETTFAIRDVRYKLQLGAKSGAFEMYDLQSDPLELENVFPLQGQNKSDWQRRLRESLSKAPRPPVARAAGRAALQSLEALGY